MEQISRIVIRCVVPACGSCSCQSQAYNPYRMEWEDAIRAVAARRRRQVMKITTDLEAAVVTFRLGCGHDLKFEVASHPVVSIELFGVNIGDELDCDRCVAAELRLN